MPSTFTRAITVAAGDVPNSRHQRSIARAANDRLRFAVDMPWRVAWALYNGARLVRNPAESPGMVFPAEGEYWKTWQHLPRGVNEWPATGPGDYEGANLGSVIPQFIFGNSELPAEPSRLEELFPMRVAGQPATTPDLVWRLGSLQRGAVTAAGAYQLVPAWEAAQSLFQFRFDDTSFHGKSFGGWQATPPQADVEDGQHPYCGDTGTAYVDWPNRIYHWTALETGVSTAGLHGTVTTNGDGKSVVTYAGSCPCGATYSDEGHILYVASMPFAWYVYTWTGDTDEAGNCVVAVDRLDKSQWVEGPYDGKPIPRHQDFPHLLRTAWHYAQEFRGADSQRTPDTFAIEDVAFDAQRFWTRQYPLAPARGVPGEGNTVDGWYPEVIWMADPGPGQHSLLDEEDEDWAPHAGFVICGFHAVATGLLAPVVVTVTAGSTVATLALTPDESGNASALVWLEDGITPASMTASLGGALTLDPGGMLVVDAAELVEYRPHLWDQYLVTRFATATGTTDPQGQDYTQAADIVPGLFTHGAILGEYPTPQPDEITPNPVYQAWRRLSRLVRVMPRESLISYTLVGEVATLRFRREVTGLSLGLDEADPWEGIAPPPYAIPSGELVRGESYVVRGASGSVTYEGHAYGLGQRFTATRTTDYTATGDAGPWVEDGIRHTALPRGWTNEWTFFLQTHAYHEADSNLWKPAIYADFFTFCAQEHWMEQGVDGAFKAFINHGYSFGEPAEGEEPGTYQTSLNIPLVNYSLINPEAPSAYTYSSGANASASDAFRKSRQVYPKPYEIAGCTLEFDGTDQIVVLRMVEKLRRHPAAHDEPTPETDDPHFNCWVSGMPLADERGMGDFSVWMSGMPVLPGLETVESTATEDYRTDDNAVRDYLAYIATGVPCPFRTGDSAYTAYINPSCRGACFPNFLFVKLVPECYEDDNDTVDPSDTRITADWMQHAALVLDCICEGFVAGATSTERACRQVADAGLYDYTRESLYYEAFEGRSIPPIAEADRDDNPIGYGPLPNAQIYAETHNRLAACFNLLTRLRMDVPLVWQTKTRQWTGSSSDVTPAGRDWYGTDGTCPSEGSPRHAWLDGAECPDADTSILAETEWQDAASATVLALRGFGLGCCGDSEWCLNSFRQEMDWRVIIDPDWSLAIPAHIQSLVDVQGVGTVAVRTELRVGHDRVAGPPYTTCAGLSMGYLWEATNDPDTVECVMVTPGTVSAPTPPTGDVAVFEGTDEETQTSELCPHENTHLVQLDLLAFPGAYVEVPLTDLP